MISQKNLQKLLFFCILLITNLEAQTFSRKDSLKTVFSKTKVDTNVVWALMDYGKIMTDENADSADFYFKKAFTLAKRLSHKKGIAQFYSDMSSLLSHRKGKLQEALSLSKEFLEFAKNEKNEIFLAGAYFSMASIYQNLEQSDSAIFYYEKSLKILDKIKLNRKIPTIYGSLSRMYSIQKMNNIALEYLDKAINMNLKLKDTSALIINYINKSTLCYQMKNKAGEEKSNREGLRLAKESKNDYLQIGLCTNMAAMFEDRQQYDSSLYYNQRAYSFAKQYGAPIKSINPLIGIVACYYKKNNYKEANKYLHLITQNPDIQRISMEQKLLITEQEINVLKALGKYKAATDLYEIYNKLVDSSTNISTQERVLEFNNKLKKAESDKVILAKEVLITKQKNWLYLLSIGGLALLVSSILFYRYLNQKTIAKNKEIKLLEQANEFIAVKSSLEGQLNERVRISKEIHDDLGSSLTTISLLTEVLKTKIDGVKVPEVAKISTASASMVDAMNEIVWALNVQNDTLFSLVAFIRKYARDFLQETPIKLIFEEDVKQDFILQGNVRRSIYLVVKEAINNVVKHAEAQEVKLNISANKNILSIAIEDDGHGILEGKNTIFGNGLKNMKQRMEDIGGTFEIVQSKGVVIKLSYDL